MHTRTFYLPGAEVQSLLAGSGRNITARVIANMALAQHGKEFSDMIAGELLRSGARTDKLLPEANEKWPGHDLGFRVQLNIDQIGWVSGAASPARRWLYAYGDALSIVRAGNVG